jgi:hypothetical protein
MSAAILDFGLPILDCGLAHARGDAQPIQNPKSKIQNQRGGAA